MKLYAEKWMDDHKVEVKMSPSEIRELAEALIEFSSKIERYRLANKGKENLGFTHLHFIDCGPYGQKSEDDLVFYVDLSEG